MRSLPAPRIRSVLCVLLLSWALGGCSLVVGGELDPLTIDPSQLRDVAVRLVSFTPHTGQPVIVEIVNPETRLIQAYARIDPYPDSCAQLDFPLGAPIAATQVDFYADIGADGLGAPTDMTNTDHTWREPLDEDGSLTFQHAFNFVNIRDENPATTAGLDLVIDISGAESMNDSSVVLALIHQVDLSLDPEAPDLRPSVNGIFAGTVVAGAVGIRRGAAMDELPRIVGIVDQGESYTIELNFANTMRCRLDARAPASGEMVVTATLADFTCDSTAAMQVYEDCSR
ncbi:MAG: hypothetical protein AB7S26_23015 [Sandaracinaceae bacterium]